MQIKVENRKEPREALEIIEKNIRNLKEKVECLQMYAPKLFKAIQAGRKEDRSMFDLQKNTLVECLQSLVRSIVDAMIDFTKHKAFKTKEAAGLEWEPKKQRIKIEDLLQIFVDDIAQMKDFLQYVIEKYGGNEAHEKHLKELTSLNLYHRLLECYLYLN